MKTAINYLVESFKEHKILGEDEDELVEMLIYMAKLKEQKHVQNAFVDGQVIADKNPHSYYYKIFIQNQNK
jgi:hypothetical protein